MKIFAIVPVKRYENSKSRLSEILNVQERMYLSGLMLDDTLRALKASKCFEEILIVSSDSHARKMTQKRHAKFLDEGYDRDVNSAVRLADRYSIGKRADATVVIPLDLPLMSPEDIAGVCKLAENDSECVVICPSLRRDGTNILLRKPPQVINTHYDNNSYEMHLKSAKELGIPVHEVESERLMFDIDTPEDVKMLVGMSKATVSADVVAWFLRGRMSKRGA